MTRTQQVQVAVAVIAAFGVIAAAVVSNWDKWFLSPSASSQKQTPVSQSSGAANSPNVANVQGNVSININPSKSQLDFPSFDESLEPLPGGRRNPEQGRKFNDFMLNQEDKTIYLSVYLTEEMIGDVTRGKDDYDRIVFTVQNNYDEFSTGGTEYLIHVSGKAPQGFEFNPKTGKLAGYFKVWGINGPRQGYMSVNLRPVKGE